MSIFSMGARLISRSSPVLLVASGAALVLTMPVVRRGLRTALVTATQGALLVSEGVSNLTEKIRAETAEIVEEARQKKCCPCPAVRNNTLQSVAKAKGRRMAVATTAGVLGVKEKAKAVQDNFNGIVDEARQLREEKMGNMDMSQEVKDIPDNTEIEPDGLEASTTDIGPDDSPKRRSARKKVTE